MRPLRRTTWQSGRSFSDLIDETTFIAEEISEDGEKRPHSALSIAKAYIRRPKELKIYF